METPLIELIKATAHLVWDLTVIAAWFCLYFLIVWVIWKRLRDFFNERDWDGVRFYAALLFVMAVFTGHMATKIYYKATLEPKREASRENR